jgi:hypothetical protein
VSIRPWGTYVAVIDPPADPNDGKIGGVILPDGFGLDVMDKAIVIGVGPCVENSEHTPEGFGVGSVVWYPHGQQAMKVGDIKFVSAEHLIAWEAATVEVEP